MEATKWVDTIVANNFRFLRKRYKDNQEVLGRMFGVSQGTISEYENGKRPIPIAVLKRISEWYNVPATDLLYKDLSKEPDPASLFTLKVLEHVVENLFFFLTSEKAENNSNFNCAYRVLLPVIQSEDPEVVYKKMPALAHAAQLFKDAWEETNEYEAIVNHLSVILMIYLVYCQPDIRITQEILNSGTFDWVEFESKLRCDPKKPKKLPQEDKRRDFFKGHAADVYEYIKTLKRTEQFSELGDFFWAVFNAVGFTDDYSEYKDRRRAGANMLSELHALGNNYVQQLCNV